MTDEENREVAELKAKVEELQSKLDFLERRVVADETERDGSVVASVAVTPPPVPVPTPYPRPFTVDYDPEEGEYYIFAPDGCVLVNGKAVEIADAQDGNVALDLDPEDVPDSLYAHVTEDSGATGGYKVEFDGNATKSGSKYDFRVLRFGASDNDGNQYDVATSVVNLGGTDITLLADAGTVPPGGSGSVKVLENVLLEPMLNSSNQPDTNLAFDLREVNGVTHVKIGVYYI